MDSGGNSLSYLLDALALADAAPPLVAAVQPKHLQARRTPLEMVKTQATAAVARHLGSFEPSALLSLPPAALLDILSQRHLDEMQAADCSGTNQIVSDPALAPPKEPYVVSNVVCAYLLGNRPPSRPGGGGSSEAQLVTSWRGTLALLLARVQSVAAPFDATEFIAQVSLSGHTAR
jgi:hypothetical protein